MLLLAKKIDIFGVTLSFSSYTLSILAYTAFLSSSSMFKRLYQMSAMTKSRDVDFFFFFKSCAFLNSLVKVKKYTAIEMALSDPFLLSYRYFDRSESTYSFG